MTSAVKLLPTNGNVCCLRPLLALGNLERNTLPLFEGLEAFAANGGVMNEHVTCAGFSLDKSVPFFVVEPLHGTLLFGANGNCLLLLAMYQPLCVKDITGGN